VDNYAELKSKTEYAIKRKSINLRKVKIFKEVDFGYEEFNEFVDNLKMNRKIIFDNLEGMIITNGIWHCLKISDGKRGILIMSNGYQYPRFIALDEEKVDKNIIDALK